MSSPSIQPALPALASSAQPTMSSREIAELVGSRHDKVKQSIERLAERGVIALPPLGEYLDTLGRKASEYRIGKRDSYVVVAQLSPEFTARLVDRWQELEAKLAAPTLPDFTNPAVAARAWAEQYEGREIAERRIAELEPKAAFVDRFVNASGLYGYEEAGTAAGCGPRKFCDWLKQEYLFYRGKKLVPRQKYVAQGLFVIKPEIDGNGDAHLRGWVTAKGVEHFVSTAPTSIRVTGVLL